jgi:vacuolar-type H+-ATPase subunit H
MQQIASAEAEANKRVQEVKEKNIKDVESYRTSEEERVEQKKTARKEETTKELKKEKESLGTILKTGGEETKKHVEELKKKCTKNEAGIISKLVDQFLTLVS